MSDLATLITKAKGGQREDLAALVEAMARDLRAFIATYATSRAMAEEVHTATWIQVRKELTSMPPNSQGITWGRQRAITLLRNQLEADRSAAIAARDGLRHLIAQDGAEGLEALVSPSNDGAALLNQRYRNLDEDTQMLISRRYGDGLSLDQLASEMALSDSDVAKRLFVARAGMHWRATAADQRAPEDPHLVVAIDHLLAEQLDGPGRQSLGATLMKDLGRAAAFARQVRIDLMLHAVFAPYSSDQARELAGVLAKIEHKRRNESSLLQVVAPPRTPIGSGSELRMANDRVGERQAATPRPAGVTAATRAIQRPGRGAPPSRRGSSDEQRPTRERPRSGRNQPLIIGGAIAVIGLIALLVLWNRGGTATGSGSAGGTLATVMTTQGGAQVLMPNGPRPATPGMAIVAGAGFDSARGETTVEIGGTVRAVLSPGTQVKSFTTLEDQRTQLSVTKGTVSIQVQRLPGIELKTEHGHITIGLGRAQVHVESDRTQVHAQGGSVTVTGADGSEALQMPADQRVEILAGGAPRLLKPATFVRGINLGGDPVTIDRNRWLSQREALSAGLSLGAGTSIAPPALFTGAGLDFDRKTMLDTGLTGSGGPVQFTQVVPDGDYTLTFWLANTAALDVSHMGLTINDQPVALANALLKRDTWAQLGPLPVRASKGRLEISLGGHGAARVCGLAIEASEGDKRSLPAAVVMTSPVEASSFFRGDKITLRAETVGRPTSVQFFSGDKLVGEATKEPWSLSTDTLPPGDHRITAKAVNPGGAPSVSLPLAFTVSEAFGSGTILVQRWAGIPGDKLANVNGHAKLDGPPQHSVEAKEFSTQSNWGQQYYCRIRGYIHPPITGDYTFWMVSDDEGELLLSTSEDPSQAKRIAHVPDHTLLREWTKTPSQQSKPIPLVGGQKYYIELRYKEHEGDDWGACGWKMPNGLMDRPISGAHLSPFKP